MNGARKVINLISRMDIEEEAKKKCPPQLYNFHSTQCFDAVFTILSYLKWLLAAHTLQYVESKCVRHEKKQSNNLFHC